MSFLKEAIVKIGDRASNFRLDPNFEASLPYNLTGKQLSGGIEHYRTLEFYSGILKPAGIVGIVGSLLVGHPETTAISAIIAVAGHLLVQEAKGRARILRHLREEMESRGHRATRILF